MLTRVPQIASLEARAHDILKLIPPLRNLLRPVNRLLSELISHIARCILDEEIISHTTDNFFKREKIIDTRSIIPLTHVCRYWRESIISTPANWTLISSRSTDLASSSLQRAKTAPLTISLDMRQVEKSTGFSALIAPHIQNAKALYIRRVSSIKGLTQTLPNFPQSMPNLRSLMLFHAVVRSNEDWSTDPFGPSIPALTSLSLISIPLYPAFLRLRTLTNLSLRNFRFNLHLDTLLDFLEENHSLESLTLYIDFTQTAFRSSQRRVPIRNRLQILIIYSTNAMDCNALISNIALKSGAHLGVTIHDHTTGPDILPSIISMAHLSNLKSPTQMDYLPEGMGVRLLGPNGSFSFEALSLDDPFARLPPTYLIDVRTFQYNRAEAASSLKPIVFSPSSLPALEKLVVYREVTISRLLSPLFSDPSSSPSLKILAFVDCDLNKDFMEELTLFASNRKSTTSAWLYRVVIASSKGIIPRFSLIDALGKYVPVDVRIGRLGIS